MRSDRRSDRMDMPWSGCRALAARSSVAEHRSPRKPTASRDHERTRRVYAPPNSVPSLSSSSGLPIPLLGPRAKEEGENPSASNQIGTRPTSRWDNAPTSRAPAPQSKPVVHASRLVTHKASSVAFGPGVKSWPQGQLTSDCTPIPAFARADVNKSPLELLRRHRWIPPSRRRRARNSLLIAAVHEG
jgi:hypothetical protein